MPAIIHNASALLQFIGSFITAARDRVYAFAISLFGTSVNYTDLPLDVRASHQLEEMSGIIAERKTSWISLTTLFGYHEAAAHDLLVTFKEIENRATAIYKNQRGNAVMDREARKELNAIRDAISQSVDTIKELKNTFPKLYAKIEPQLVRISPLYHSYDSELPGYEKDKEAPLRIAQLQAYPLYAREAFLYTRLDRLRDSLSNAVEEIRAQLNEQQAQLSIDDSAFLPPIDISPATKQELKEARRLTEYYGNLQRQVYIGRAFDYLLTDTSGGIAPLLGEKGIITYLEEAVAVQESDLQTERTIHSTLEHATEATVQYVTDGLSAASNAVAHVGTAALSMLFHTII